MIDILLINGTVITMDNSRRIIENGAVAVKGDRIYEVGSAKELKEKYEKGAKKVIDCYKKLILPGFIDTHSHAGHCMFKSLAYDTSSY